MVTSRTLPTLAPSPAAIEQVRTADEDAPSPWWCRAGTCGAPSPPAPAPPSPPYFTARPSFHHRRAPPSHPASQIESLVALNASAPIDLAGVLAIAKAPKSIELGHGIDTWCHAPPSLHASLPPVDGRRSPAASPLTAAEPPFLRPGHAQPRAALPLALARGRRQSPA
jgi:hypothetical protein|uniref:Uncharacterized protein n=1 Tax=Oryza sativa subsp. japonica TaxID=39947 RepID=Q69WG6_ORYSJ|nr:unknown protein [Oryza sativa Japonica Group]BAD61882.1 unknown protein [Oryza sativa Japonica Group]